MSEQSRREFIKAGIYRTLGGLAALLVPWLAAGKTRTKKGIDPDFIPPYFKLHQSGELKKRAKTLWDMMKSCELCPRECGANRLKGDRGFCRSSSQLVIHSFNPHFGEESPLVGRGGSGTIFFSNCNLRCIYCQNWQINHEGQGTARTIDSLTHMMIKLQDIGCSNINLVTPTHYSPHILLAVDMAAKMGLRLPIVYNTSGWEKLEILKELDGVVDIYLPDFKYGDSEMAARYSSGADTYPQVTQKALLEMNRQVGVATPAKDGLMYRGLMIRHLVLPNRTAGSKKVVEWIGESLPKETFVNIMAQYRPEYKAHQYPKIARRITRQEYREVLRWAKEAGLTNVNPQRFLFF